MSYNLNSAVLNIMSSILNYSLFLIVLVEINVLFGHNFLDNQYYEEEANEVNSKNNGMIYYFT